MKLLVGLGNPGKKYAKNRHNVGFMFLDWMTKGQAVWKQSGKFYGETCEKEVEHEKFILLKPDTFMNDSGKAVAAVAGFYKINVSDIYIVHDDLDIAFGSFKIQQGRGPKVHNGITSIEQSVGSSDFWRIRIGVDGRDQQNRMEGQSYVLQDFMTEEIGSLHEKLFDEVYKKIQLLLL